ncbi:hypothetical protein SB96558_4251 [Shigella boydii 965-58]|nr:hypothetical protein SB96558_4251 [Shigella boydii 965-58]
MGAIVARQDNFHKTSLMGRLRKSRITALNKHLKAEGQW